MSEVQNSEEGVIIAKPKFEHTTFEKGIIGKWTNFLTKRFGTGPMLGKAVGVVITSMALADVELKDKKGSVKANLFIVDIGPTGLANKTPVLRIMRDVVYDFGALGPSRFTPEGLPNYIKPKKRRKSEEVGVQLTPEEILEEERDRIRRTRFVIVKDEISRLLADRIHKTYMDGMDEVLSDAWDGYIQSNYTNKRGLEGGLKCYVSLYGAGSYRFLQILDEEFFVQGLGNRILWIDEAVHPPQLNRDFFFEESRDDELEQLKSETLEELRYIKENVEMALLSSPDMWLEWVNSFTSEMEKKEWWKTLGDREGEYKSKMVLNMLKLAMCYAASEFSIQTSMKTLSITRDNIKMAVEDAETFIGMWKSLMNKCDMLSGQGSRPADVRMPRRKKDTADMLMAAKKIPYITQKILKSELDISDNKLIAELIALGVSKEFLEKVEDERVLVKFKPVSGPTPEVFRLTEKGSKHLDGTDKQITVSESEKYRIINSSDRTV